MSATLGRQTDIAFDREIDLSLLGSRSSGRPPGVSRVGPTSEAFRELRDSPTLQAGEGKGVSA